MPRRTFAYMYFQNINRSNSAKNSFQEVASTGLKTYLNFGWGFVRDPTWGAYSEPRAHSQWGRGLLPLCKNRTPVWALPASRLIPAFHPETPPKINPSYGREMGGVCELTSPRVGTAASCPVTLESVPHCIPFTALTLLIGRREGHPARKNLYNLALDVLSRNKQSKITEKNQRRFIWKTAVKLKRR